MVWTSLLIGITCPPPHTDARLTPRRLLGYLRPVMHTRHASVQAAEAQGLHSGKQGTAKWGLEPERAAAVSCWDPIRETGGTERITEQHSWSTHLASVQELPALLVVPAVRTGRFHW